MTIATTSTFENEHISVTATVNPGCQATLQVITKAPAAQAARHAAKKEVVKAVEIPGFRKGKAPLDMIEKQFASQIEKEFHDVLVRNAVNEAIKLSNIRPFTQETDIRVTKFDPEGEGNFKVEFQFESFPELPSINLNSIKFDPESAKETTSEDIQKKIEELQLYHAEWQEVTDRGAQDEDFVVLDVDLLHEGKETPIHRSNRFKVAEGRMPAWVRHVVKGMKTGESKTGMSEKEGEDSDKEFTPQEFRFTVNKVQQAILPPLDEALCKKAGVDTVELLKEAIEKRVKQEHENLAKQRNRLAMQKLICETFPFEMPASRLEKLQNECDSLAEAESGEMSSSKEKQDYAEQLFKEAERSVRLSYLIPKLYQEHHLAHPTGAEIQQRATEKMIQRYMANPGAEQIDPDTLIRVSENELIHERALDFLLENVKNA